MTDEGKLREQVSRGERARRIYESDLFTEAAEAIEKEILASITGSLGDEQAVRERAYLMFRLLQNFKQQFKHAMTTGHVASAELLRVKDPPLQKLVRTINGRR
jgi:hypothetical protein